MSSNMTGVTIIRQGTGNHGKWLDFSILGEFHRAYLKLRKVHSGTGEVRTFHEFDLVYDLDPKDLFVSDNENVH